MREVAVFAIVGILLNLVAAGLDAEWHHFVLTSGLAFACDLSVKKRGAAILC